MLSFMQVSLENLPGILPKAGGIDINGKDTTFAHARGLGKSPVPKDSFQEMMALY